MAVAGGSFGPTLAFGSSQANPFSIPNTPFGSSSTPAAGAPQSSSGLFGSFQQPASVFGSQATTAGLFGGQTTFGSSTPNMFGSTQTAPSSAPSLFGAQSSPTPFGVGAPQSASPPFGSQPVGLTAGGFNATGQPGALVLFQGQPQQYLQQPALNVQTVVTADGRWAVHSTQFAAIHPEGQKELRRLE